jgi:hypothetical protein
MIRNCYAEARDEQRNIVERQTDISRLEAQGRAAPVEVDAARAAEAAARAQLDQQKQGATFFGHQCENKLSEGCVDVSCCSVMSSIIIACMSADYDRREQEVRFQLNELTKGIANYRRLGLEFEKINDDRLRLVFTLIDPRAPEKKFSFTVKITDSDVYRVDTCEPAVPRLADLLNTLNETNDFSAFVQSMRSEFKLLATGMR